MPNNTWRTILRQLVARGFLEIDIAAYGALRLAPKAGGLLRGEEEFRYRPDVKSKSETGSKQKTREAVADLAPEAETLFARLKALRTDLAKARGVPAYAIFPDKALIDMAARRPANDEEFGEVYGVGKAKQKKFGALFLDAIRQEVA